MTKEEIEKLADKWYNENGKIKPSIVEKTAFIKGFEYADQQTSELKAELNELKERHKHELEIEYKKGFDFGTSEAIKELRKNYRPND